MVQDYRRRLNRAERRKAEKAGDGSGAALREAAEEAEFERAKVRPFAFAMLCPLENLSTACVQQLLSELHKDACGQSGTWFHLLFLHGAIFDDAACQTACRVDCFARCRSG